MQVLLHNVLLKENIKSIKHTGQGMPLGHRVVIRTPQKMPEHSPSFHLTVLSPGFPGSMTAVLELMEGWASTNFPWSISVSSSWTQDSSTWGACFQDILYCCFQDILYWFLYIGVKERMETQIKGKENIFNKIMENFPNIRDAHWAARGT